MRVDIEDCDDLFIPIESPSVDDASTWVSIINALKDEE